MLRVSKAMIEEVKDTLEKNKWTLEEYIADKINRIKRHLDNYLEDFNDLNLKWCYSNLKWLIVAEKLISHDTDLEKIRELVKMKKELH